MLFIHDNSRNALYKPLFRLDCSFIDVLAGNVKDAFNQTEIKLSKFVQTN